MHLRADDKRRFADVAHIATGSLGGTMDTPGGADQRVHRRVTFHIQVTASSDHNFFVGFSENISEGGIFVATYNILQTGHEIECELHLFGEVHKVRGVVRWTREHNDLTPEIHPGMGIQFVDLPSETRVAIARFVDERSPLFYE